MNIFVTFPLACIVTVKLNKRKFFFWKTGKKKNVFLSHRRVLRSINPKII